MGGSGGRRCLGAPKTRGHFGSRLGVASAACGQSVTVLLALVTLLVHDQLDAHQQELLQQLTVTPTRRLLEALSARMERTARGRSERTQPRGQQQQTFCRPTTDTDTPCERVRLRDSVTSAVRTGAMHDYQERHTWQEGDHSFEANEARTILLSLATAAKCSSVARQQSASSRRLRTDTCWIGTYRRVWSRHTFSRPY